MAGRPKIGIDWSMVDEYLRAGCEGTSIAGLIGMHPETLYRRCVEDQKVGFTEYAASKRAEGDEILKMEQWKMATGKANDAAELSAKKAMLIWLGKNRLGQSDRSEVTDTTKPIRIDVTHISQETVQALTPSAN